MVTIPNQQELVRFGLQVPQHLATLAHRGSETRAAGPRADAARELASQARWNRSG